MSIHLILYSNNEPYNTTKQLTIDSVHMFTKKNIIIHNYNLEKIKNLYWFQKIQDLPIINRPGRRDGYYNIWKSFIVKDVFDMMNDNDILYYVDSSQYFKIGFTENFDKLCDIANEKLCIAGSIGSDVKNNSFGCCDNLIIWNKIIPYEDNTKYLNYPHVLNSWFLFKKCEQNSFFINEWCLFSCYTDEKNIKYPLVTYHHTGDQSIFNILVIKYNLPVFYKDDIYHDENKNKNKVLNVINNTDDYNKYFIHLKYF
jgi:hypothetical protein